MEISGKVWLLFEQSGTFKHQFKLLGYDAVDVDIQNNFGETDYQIDLFKEIEDAYDGKPSLFDSIRGGQDGDLIMAFFPCIYFCSNNSMIFDGSFITWKQQGKTELEKNEMILERSRERQHYYELILKLFSVCTMRGIRLIVENPYSTLHYLHANFPYKPKVIDRDRRVRGDWFAKPTQYWFHNCEPTSGLTEFRRKDTKTVASLTGHKGGLCGENRSMISPEYARNFICDFVIGKDQLGSCLSLF